MGRQDAGLVSFLQWALPRLGMRWAGFRKVRRQVGRRIGRRLGALGLPDLAAYRARLERDPAEWRVLEVACRVTISCFFRDRGVWRDLETRVLPALARQSAGTLRAWVAGCASGEEAYSLAYVGRAAGIALEILATDVDPILLERARAGVYPESSLREVAEPRRRDGFEACADGWRLRDRFRRGTTFAELDLASEMPEGPFDLVLCRNLVFTYWSETRQRAFVEGLAPRVVPGGALVVGAHETLPRDVAAFEPWEGAGLAYRRS